MKRLVIAVLAALPLSAQVLPGHRLPEGKEHPVREREVHIQAYKADLRFDMVKEEISGTASLTFTPLRSGLKSLTLDAADLVVTKVDVGGKPAKFTAANRKLTIELSGPLDPGDAGTAAVTYTVRPKTGMYFFPKSAKRGAQAWNYGEGGLHYGWLPIYNDTNDKFTVEWNVTVARPYSAIANGALAQTRENADGTRTFRWVQDKPIPNYLMTVDVGEFVRVPLDDAHVGKETVPLAVWTPPGTEDAVLSFKGTPRMVEYFSRRFATPYPWAKYDQVVLREFAVGAMETTTATGFQEGGLHRDGDPPDDAPQREAYPTWAAEDTISHELAHHWFGDLVTCRSLGSIWLNESFATFCHTLWNGEAHGEDDLTAQRWRYLNHYLAYVRDSGTVRPMEFARYSAPHVMYQQDLTYLKGALVLHMLRHFVGDADFFRTLADYLAVHRFGNVDSADLKSAFEKGCGRNFDWFFADWVTQGGGHPAFDVSYRWVPERKAVDLTVKQVQADLPFENDFRLPVDVEIVTAAGARTHTVELSGWSTNVSLPADGKPLAVVFDKGGWLVSEVKYTRPVAEIRHQLSHGGLADRLRAARQLATDYPRRTETVDALARLLADPKTHWGLRQEAAEDLGSCGTGEATAALVSAAADPDRRVRRAVAMALAVAGGGMAEAQLRKLADSDRAEDVAAIAEAGLGQLRTPGAKDFLKRQLARDSRYMDWIRLGALQGLGYLNDPDLVPVFAGYTDARHDQRVRLAALDGWFAALPDDPKLSAVLRELTRDRNRAVKDAAIQKLAALHHAEDRKLLADIAEHDPDPDFAAAAQEAVEALDGFLKSR